MQGGMPPVPLLPPFGSDPPISGIRTIMLDRPGVLLDFHDLSFQLLTVITVFLGTALGSGHADRCIWLGMKSRGPDNDTERPAGGASFLTMARKNILNAKAERLRDGRHLRRGNLPSGFPRALWGWRRTSVGAGEAAILQKLRGSILQPYASS